MKRFLLVALTGFIACRSGLRLEDRLDPEVAAGPANLEFVEKSSHIVVGTVLAVEQIAGPVKASRMPGVLLDLERVTLRVEHVLKGSVEGPIVLFHIFTYSTKNTKDFPRPWYEPAPTQRRMFFLEKQAGKYRSVGDVVRDYALFVCGRPSRAVSSSEEKPVHQRVSEILLTPGDGCDPELFAGNIWHSGHISRQLTSEAEAVRLLTVLLSDPNEGVRKEAAQTIRAYAVDTEERLRLQHGVSIR